jgi:hypothetical protein
MHRVSARQMKIIFSFEPQKNRHNISFCYIILEFIESLSHSSGIKEAESKPVHK